MGLRWAFTLFYVVTGLVIVKHDHSSLPAACIAEDPRARWGSRNLGRTGAPGMVALVTAGRPPMSPVKAEKRDYEYSLGLEYMFSAFDTVVGAVTSVPQPWPLMASYPWDKLVYYKSTQFSKAGRETDGIRALIAALDADGPAVHPWLADNNTVIVKLSGRYQPVRDTLVRAIHDFPECEAWGRTAGLIYDGLPVDYDGESDGKTLEIVFRPGDEAVMSFFFAMRLGHFRELYSTRPDSDGFVNWHFDDPEGRTKAYLVEHGLRDYIHRTNLTFCNMTRLNVLADVDTRGYLRMY